MPALCCVLLKYYYIFVFVLKNIKINYTILFCSVFNHIFWLAFVLRCSRETEPKGCICICIYLFIIRHCSHDYGGWEAPRSSLGRLETQESWCWLSSSPRWRPENQDSRWHSSTQKPQARDPRWANISIQVQSTGKTYVPAQGSRAEGVPLTHRRVSLLCCSGLPLNEPTSEKVNAQH